MSLIDTRIKGKVLYADTGQVFRGYKNRLYVSSDSGASWSEFFSIRNAGIKESLISKSHLLSRLFRFGFHHLAKDNENDYGIVFNKNIGLLKNRSLSEKSPLSASRPLSLEPINGKYVFGEYRSNPERSPISVRGFNQKDLNSKLYAFTEIRHIHGIYQDPYTSEIWITTGDLDTEAALYCTKDNFKTMEKVLSGSQQTRTIKLLFTKDFIYFGSDAPDEVNYLYRMDKSSYSIDRLAQVGSSVFHGYKVSNWLFFSTAIEPSKINHTDSAEVWASPDGVQWKCLMRFKKDYLSMRYFQYGQVFFPNGMSDNENLWISPFATEFDNLSFKIELKHIERRFGEIKS